MVFISIKQCGISLYQYRYPLWHFPHWDQMLYFHCFFLNCVCMKIILLITVVVKTNKACLFPCLAGSVYLKEKKNTKLHTSPASVRQMERNLCCLKKLHKLNLSLRSLSKKQHAGGSLMVLKLQFIFGWTNFSTCQFRFLSFSCVKNNALNFLTRSWNLTVMISAEVGFLVWGFIQFVSGRNTCFSS